MGRGGGLMRVAVDAELCQGHGRCYALAPTVYRPDAEGYNAARGQVIAVAAERDTLARRGAKACPEAALAVLEDRPAERSGRRGDAPDLDPYG